MRQLPKLLLFTAALVAGASAALAGSRYSYPVTVDRTSRNAYGSQGSARNSTDGLQSIQCSVQSYSPSGTWVSCYAMDAGGWTGSCYSYAPNLLEMAKSITNDSYISFAWDTSGVCTSLYINSSSTNEPKR